MIQSLYSHIRLLFARFESNENRKNAASLTFVTLFAIVPLMTVGFGALKLFPQFGEIEVQMQDFVFEHFLPTSGEQIKSYVQGFSLQASKLTWVGIGFLTVSAFSLLLTLESAFNRVWKVHSGRFNVRRYVLYGLFLTLGPLFMGVAFIMSSYLLALPFWPRPEATEIVISGIVKSLPFILEAMALTLLYFVMPGCRVAIKHAFIGALCTAVFLEMGKLLFVWSITLFPSYKLVYGAFAIVPLFLMWIYIAWCIVLFGAEIVHSLGFSRRDRKGIKATDLDWALMLVKIIHTAGQSSTPVFMSNLTEKLPLANADEWESILATLIQCQWVKEQSNGEYQLSVDITSMPLVSLSDIINRSRMNKLSVEWRQSPWYSQLSPLFNQLFKCKQEYFSLSIDQVITKQELSHLTFKK